MYIHVSSTRFSCQTLSVYVWAIYDLKFSQYNFVWIWLMFQNGERLWARHWSQFGCNCVNARACVNDTHTLNWIVCVFQCLSLCDRWMMCMYDNGRHLANILFNYSTTSADRYLFVTRPKNKLKILIWLLCLFMRGECDVFGILGELRWNIKMKKIDVCCDQLWIWMYLKGFSHTQE